MRKPANWRKQPQRCGRENGLVGESGLLKPCGRASLGGFSTGPFGWSIFDGMGYSRGW
jgi:hypothetical protein